MLTPQGFTETKTATDQPGTQLLPHSVEAEVALLGALAIDPAQMLDVGYLDKSDFYLLNNGLLYQAMKVLFEKHQGYDWLTVTEHLRSAGHLEDIGGEVALVDLMNATPTSYGAPEYASIVYRHSISRQVINQTMAITQMAFSNGLPGENLVNEAIDRLAGIDASRNVSNGPQSIKSGVECLFDRMEEIDKSGTMAGLSTGLKSLDRILGGLQANKLYLLAGRPGMGKSGLALQIAYNVARQGVPVLFFALEMSADDIAARLMSSICGVPYEEFNRPIEQRHWPSIIDAQSKVAALPLIIDCTPGLSVANIRSITQKTMLKHPIGLIIVDHGGIVRPEKRTGNQYQDQTQNALKLMALPKQLGLPVLSLLQLSRAVENTTDKRPKPYHLRDTGEWEQNGDGILLLYRDEVYNPDTEYPGLGEISIGKNRGGKTGEVMIAANVALNRFVDLETREVRL